MILGAAPPTMVPRRGPLVRIRHDRDVVEIDAIVNVVHRALVPFLGQSCRILVLLLLVKHHFPVTVIVVAQFVQLVFLVDLAALFP